VDTYSELLETLEPIPERNAISTNKDGKNNNDTSTERSPREADGNEGVRRRERVFDITDAPRDRTTGKEGEHVRPGQNGRNGGNATHGDGSRSGSVPGNSVRGRRDSGEYRTYKYMQMWAIAGFKLIKP
jgi:hypothetical protein